MAVPIGIFVLAFGVGSVLPARLLPGLARDRVGTTSLLVVCALIGAVLALIGVHVYEIVRQLDNPTGLVVASAKPDIVANGILTTLRDAGPVLGLAGAVYLLAPPAGEENERSTEHIG